MSALLRRYPLIAGLVVLAAILVAVLALEIASGNAMHERYSASAHARATPVQTRLLPPIAAVNPEQEYPETAARPLFTPTRRPAPSAVAAGGPSSMSKGQFTLTGVIIANGLKTALLRETRSGRVVRVEQGKEVNGMTVAEIEPEKVTLTQAGDQEVLALLVSKQGPMPAPAPALPTTGPFAAPPSVTMPGAPAVAAPAPPEANPAARAPQVPQGNPGFGPPPPGAAPQPQSQSAGPFNAAQSPLTPEQLLAQRRLRRAQQSQ